MSRAVRRVSEIEEDHPIQTIGSKAHAITYPYDPQTIYRFKLGLQARLRATSNEYQLLPALARIGGSGSYQARVGASISVPVHDEAFDPRFGGHLGYDLMQNIAVTWWLQVSGDCGIESRRARVGVGVGVQLVDLLRFGFAYHHGIGEMDDAWRDKWGRREQLAFIAGMNLETAWGLVF